MAEKKPHQVVINKVTKNILLPAGIQQKGRSRLWYVDCGWYTIAVEFTPHKYRLGTSLTLGIHWLWYPNDYWAFDIPYHIGGFAEFQDEAQFTEVVTAMANIVIDVVNAIRSQFETLDGAYQYTKSQQATDWSNLHLGILATLTGHIEAGRQLISSRISDTTDIEWVIKHNNYINTWLEVTKSQPTCAALIENYIEETRFLLKLKAIAKPLLPSE
jgi:hypothetical protein